MAVTTTGRALPNRLRRGWPEKRTGGGGGGGRPLHLFATLADTPKSFSVPARMPSGERYPRFCSLPPELTFVRRTLDGRNQSPAGQRPRTRAAKLWGWTQLLGPTSEHDPVAAAGRRAGHHGSAGWCGRLGRRGRRKPGQWIRRGVAGRRHARGYQGCVRN